MNVSKTVKHWEMEGKRTVKKRSVRGCVGVKKIPAQPKCGCLARGPQSFERERREAWTAEMAPVLSLHRCYPLSQKESSWMKKPWVIIIRAILKLHIFCKKYYLRVYVTLWIFNSPWTKSVQQKKTNLFMRYFVPTRLVFFINHGNSFGSIN